MATLYFRGTGAQGIWWVKFYHPLDARCLRTSLGTGDENKAKRILRRLEVDLELHRPEIANTRLPEKLASLLVCTAETSPQGWRTNGDQFTTYPLKEPSPDQSTSLVEALGAYYIHIAADNDSHHVSGKLSILRAFFGSSLIEQATGQPCREITPPSYQEKNLEGITPLILQQFLTDRKIVDSTRKHYREVFHHFFEKMIDLSLYVPSNTLRPNPAAALPQYAARNAVISFLTEKDVEEQIKALSSEPIIQLGVEIMIHAGLRREEAVGLRTEDIGPEAKLIRVSKYIDPRTGKPRKLKTGYRKVPVTPILRERLLKHLEGHNNFWLLPGWNNERWTADNFSKTLSELNRKAGLAWTCNEFRHSYATSLAKGGASLFRIAKLMGNSHQIVERHYAQFVLDDDE